MKATGKIIFFLVITVLAAVLFLSTSYIAIATSLGYHTQVGIPETYLYIEARRFPYPYEEFYAEPFVFNVIFWYLASAALVLGIRRVVHIRRGLR